MLSVPYVLDISWSKISVVQAHQIVKKIANSEKKEKHL